MKVAFLLHLEVSLKIFRNKKGENLLIFTFPKTCLNVFIFNSVCTICTLRTKSQSISGSELPEFPYL